MVALTAERRPGPARRTARRAAATAHAQRMARPLPKAGVPGVGAIIAVASGKGGVGKSTVAVNLALGLQAIGLKVGILDADIYGPSMPRLLGLRGRPESLGGRTLKPMERYGLKVMSIGFLVEEETPMIWRGPMVQSALVQMLREVAWGELDVLVVDMPPGTGDAQLTMAQQVPLAGAVIVSTPQDLALIDARKGLAMFQRVDVPVLGIVENMSYFLCPHCGERTDIFGHGGAEHEAARIGVPFLGAVPLHVKIRELSDAGTPVVASEPDGEHAAYLPRDRRRAPGRGSRRSGRSPDVSRRRSSWSERLDLGAVPPENRRADEDGEERRDGHQHEHRHRLSRSPSAAPVIAESTAPVPICAAPESPAAAPAISGFTLIAPEIALGSESPLASPSSIIGRNSARGLASPSAEEQSRQRRRDEGERRAGKDHPRDAEALGEAAGDEVPEHIADRRHAEPQAVDARRQMEHPLRNVRRAAEEGEEHAGREAAARGEEQEIAASQQRAEIPEHACRS